MFGTAEKSIAVKLQELSLEATSLQDKINVDKLKLEGARQECERIADGLARGTAKESDLTKNRDTIAVIEARIGANTAQLGPIKAEVDELAREHYRQEQAAAKETHEKEFAELQRKGAAIAQGLVRKLEELIATDVRQFDDIRARLVTEFADLGGEETVRNFYDILIARYPSAVGELHLASLRRRGWKPFWRFVNGRLGNPGYPLPPIKLTVCSMNPPE